jgi:hypothetical protein
MKTTYPLVLVMAMAMAGMMLTMGTPGGTSFSDGIGEDKSSDQLTTEFEDTSASSNVGTDSMPTGGVTGMIFLVINAAQQLFTMIMMVVLLPFQLRNLGFPALFAYPVGLGVQLITSIGIISFLAGRVYR